MSRIDLEAVFNISDLLVRSPSCSCVLEDVLEILAESVGFDAGVVGVLNQVGKPGLIAHYGKSGTEAIVDEVLKTLLKTQGEDVIQEKYDWFGNRLIPRETGDYLVVSFPLWLENKIKGVFCLVGNKVPFLNSFETRLLHLATNQISQAIEKELLKESLAHMEYSFNSVLESVTEGIVIYNKQKVLYFNQTARNMLKLEEEAENMALPQFTHWVCQLSKDKLKSLIYLETAFSLKYPRYSFELETGEGRFLRFTAFLLNDNWKGEIGAGFLLSDITRQKEAEQFKDDMLAITSHELRTPLTSIKGNVSALLRTDVTWGEEDRRLFLQDVYEECERLDDLIRNQLDIAKINAGALRLDLSLITVADLFKRVKQQLEKRYTKPCSIKYDIAPPEAVLDVDIQRITQVILNLVDNAVKHGPEGVAVEIAVKKKNRHLEFSVKDNGFGILPKHQKNIFDKYYSVKRGYRQLSSGLGLAICKGIVEAHKGSIWLESVAGEGSCFSFTLPLKR